MNAPTCIHPGVRVLLGFYVLGKLNDTDRTAVSRHLAECASCSAELAELVGAVSVLSLLGPEDIGSLLGESDEPAVDVPPVGALIADGPSSPAGGSPSTGSPLPAHPGVGSGGTGPRDNRPRGQRQARRRLRLALGAGAAVVVTVVGVVGALLAVQPDPRPPAPAGLTVSAVAGPARIGMSVTIVPVGDGVELRFALSNLRPQARYELLAVTGGGQTLSVAAVTGQSGTQDVVGTLAVPATALAFLSLQQPDGVVLATAIVPRSSATPR